MNGAAVTLAMSGETGVALADPGAPSRLTTRNERCDAVAELAGKNVIGLPMCDVREAPDRGGRPCVAMAADPALAADEDDVDAVALLG
jgi:hypothetical protein